MNGWMDGLINGWMDGWTDRWRERLPRFENFQKQNLLLLEQQPRPVMLRSQTLSPLLTDASQSVGL